MQFNLTTTPIRYPRFFQRLTLLQVQVRTGGGSIHYGGEMGEVANPSPTSDGLILTAANTGGTTSPPFPIWWKGELWLSSESTSVLIVIVVGEQDEPRCEAARYGTEVSKKLDMLQSDGFPASTPYAGARR